ELVGDDVQPLGKALQHVQVVETADDQVGQFFDRRFRCGIEEAEAQTQRVAGQGQHATQLTAAEDADLHAPSRGSGCARTFCVCSSRYRASAPRYGGCFPARMAVASRAALTAPA